MLGVGRWAPSFAYLYLSSGVGGGLMLNGDLWRGRYGNAGEFAGGLPPNIYPFPNLELLRVLAARDGISFETVDELVSNYDPSWQAIDEWISRVNDSVSIIISNATAILDPDAIVMGSLIPRSEEHTSELQSLMRISYAVFCLKKNKKYNTHIHHPQY